MAPDTYAQVLSRNIRAARSRVDIGQENVAARMRALGFSAWLRQTVGATERGRRRPTTEEIFGLAFALETSIPRLMSPIDEDREVELQAGGPAIEVTTMRLLAVGKIPVGVIEWEDDKPVEKEGIYHSSAIRNLFRQIADEEA